MELKEIIYYNEYSGITEPCSQVDVKNNQIIETEYGNFKASFIARKLYMDEEVSLALYKSVAISITDLLEGKPKKCQGTETRKAIFRLIHKSSESLVIDLKETFEGKSPLDIGKIEFYKKNNEVINGVKGNAVIRIFDVNIKAAYELQANLLLGAFSLAVGLYYFVDLGGNWESLNHDGSFIDVATNESAKQIKKAIDKATSVVQKGTDDLLEGQSIILDNQTDMLSEINSRFDSVDSKLAKLQSQIEDIAGSMKIYKEDISRALEKADDESEREIAREQFADRVVDKVVSTIKMRDAMQDYERELNLLKLNFKDNWDKLNESSQQFLLTAKVLFAQMSNIKQEIDYSGVCILVTKALEVELKQRFYFNFQEYLIAQFGNQMEEWHSALKKRKYNRNGLFEYPLDEHSCTLGTIPYICCHKKTPKATMQQYEISKQRLFEYASEVLNLKKDREPLLMLLAEIGNDINHIKEKYRNPAAHTGGMTKIDAEGCFDEVTDVEKLLVKVLSYFKE